MVRAKYKEGQSWNLALKKVREEGKCRNCGLSRKKVKLDAAHTINRKEQDEERREIVEEGGFVGYGAKMIRWVNPDSIIPLCSGIDSNDCHREYDAHRLDILPLLTNAEQANAVAAVGIVRALQRLTSNKEVLS